MLVSNGKPRLIRRRETVDDLLALEVPAPEQRRSLSRNGFRGFWLKLNSR